MTEEEVMDHELEKTRAAFDRLKRDAHAVDTMAALREVEGRQKRGIGPIVIGVFGAAAAAIFIVVGFALARDDDREVLSGDDPDQTTVPTTSGDNSSDGDEVTAVDDLAGSSWVFASGFGSDGDIPLVEGRPITLDFNDGNVLGGTAACNSYGGDYATDENAFRLGEVAQTEMGCEPDVMASESAFLTALRGVDSIDVRDGRLVLTGPDTELLFDPAVPVPTAELVGQLWLLDTIIDGEAAMSVGGTPATLLLTDDGMLEGSTGCRTFDGEYVIVGSSVEFTSWGLEGECPQQLADQDNRIVSVLGDGFTAEVDGDRLTLTSAGDEGLVYSAIDEVPTDDVEPDLVSIGELLDLRPEGVVNVSGHLVDNGGGWFLCEGLRREGLPICTTRWVVVTNVGSEVLDPLGPTTESDEFRSITYTEDPIILTGELLKDGRFALDGEPSGVDPTDGDVALLAAFTDLDPAAPDTSTLPLSADGVQMGLGVNLFTTRTATELADPANWEMNLEAFRGYVGPFSALELLGREGQITTTVGPHDHCASPPTAMADELREFRQLSIQPDGIDSCLQWWTVDLFVDDAGEVVAITLDLWEP